MHYGETDKQTDKYFKAKLRNKKKFLLETYNEAESRFLINNNTDNGH